MEICHFKRKKRQLTELSKSDTLMLNRTFMLQFPHPPKHQTVRRKFIEKLNK